MEKKVNHTAIAITAIIVIGILELGALQMGYNGYLLTGVVAIIAGLAGWVAPQLKIPKS